MQIEIDGLVGIRRILHIDAHKVLVLLGFGQDALQVFSTQAFVQCKTDLCQLNGNIRPNITTTQLVQNRQNILGRLIGLFWCGSVLPQVIECGHNPTVVQFFHNANGILQ